MRRGIVALVALAVIAAGCGGGEERVVVAAGTTLVDSGFVERVLGQYPAEVRTSVVAASSREAFALGSGGSAELMITHLEEAEQEFLAAHPGAEQSPVFTSEFVLVGPSGEPLAAPDVVAAFRQIAAEGRPFVSRGDGSGTAAREEQLWGLAGIDPSGETWYIETGQGMGFTLQVADQRDAFTLAEMGTFLAAESITLVPFIDARQDDRLANPYRVTLIPEASEEARSLYHWLLGADGFEAMMAADRELFGSPIYLPASPGLQQ